LPKNKRSLETIKISRNNNDNSRHFSQQYIDAVINCVASLKNNTSVNVYATTNPMNTKYIAKRAFGSGDRGNVDHLYVFQQSKNGNRNFEMQGRKIY
jgi:aspartokinase